MSKVRLPCQLDKQKRTLEVLHEDGYPVLQQWSNKQWTLLKPRNQVWVLIHVLDRCVCFTTKYPKQVLGTNPTQRFQTLLPNSRTYTNTPFILAKLRQKNRGSWAATFTTLTHPSSDSTLVIHDVQGSELYTLLRIYKYIELPRCVDDLHEEFPKCNSSWVFVPGWNCRGFRFGGCRMEHTLIWDGPSGRQSSPFQQLKYCDKRCTILFRFEHSSQRLFWPGTRLRNQSGPTRNILRLEVEEPTCVGSSAKMHNYSSTK